MACSSSCTLCIFYGIYLMPFLMYNQQCKSDVFNHEYMSICTWYLRHFGKILVKTDEYIALET